MARARFDVTSLDLILWHDAEIVRLALDLTDSGEMIVTLRCALHPDEPQQVLVALGIATPMVDVCFYNASEVRLHFHADTSNRELIDTFRVESAPIGIGMWFHFAGSSGAVVQLHAGEVWIEEVAE